MVLVHESIRFISGREGVVVMKGRNRNKNDQVPRRAPTELEQGALLTTDRRNSSSQDRETTC